MSERPEDEAKSARAAPDWTNGAQKIRITASDGSMIQMGDDGVFCRDPSGWVGKWTGLGRGRESEWQDVVTGEMRWGAQVNFDYTGLSLPDLTEVGE
jgi:hypothetical protein